MKRLHENFNVQGDCCVTGNVVSRGTEHNNPAGVYLGPNPEALGKDLYITFWTAVEIAHLIGYPMPEVYEQMQQDLEDQEQEIADLKRKLNDEIHTEQVQAVFTKIDNRTKEILHAIEGRQSADGSDGSKPQPAPRKPVKRAGGKPTAGRLAAAAKPL